MNSSFKYSPRAITIAASITLFLGLLIWASLTSLDYGVHAEGTVKNRHSNIPIQHDTVARVAKIMVVEGQMVKRGQTLMQLDESDAIAEAMRAETQAFILALQYESALAEERQAGYLRSPQLPIGVLSPEVKIKAKEDADRSYMQRMASYRAQIAQFAADIKTAAEQMARLSEEIVSIDEQITILSRKIARLKPLQEGGYVTRSMLDDMRMRLAELNRMKSERLSEYERLNAIKEQTDLKRTIYLADREREIRTRLAELAPQVQAAYDAAKAASVKLKSRVIVAATDGQIINLKVKSIGEVVGAGMLLMELVPSERSYYVEAHIGPAQIENMKPGMSAEINFITLPKKSTPYLYGSLEAISSNSTVNERTGETYYVATIAFKDDVEKALGLKPALGMPVSVMLKGGTRSVMSYITDPFRLLMRRAMKET